MTRRKSWVDARGRPFDWSFMCGACPEPGVVYVRDGTRRHRPGRAAVAAAVRAHRERLHPWLLGDGEGEGRPLTGQP